MPAPETLQTDDERFVAPRSEVEELLADIWREVLDVERVGVFDSFFELGGHSLQITQILSQVRDELDIDVPPRALFEAPTVAGLAQAVATALMLEVGEEDLSEILQSAT